ncbi:MAG: VWA domain-containing protein [Bryobacteraceae bacterium]
MIRFGVVCFVLVLSAAAQEPIRVEVNLVNVAFTVRDAKGNLATDLTRDDFEILEDGVPQKISYFARSADVPLTLGLVMDMSGSQETFMKPHHRDLGTFLKEVMEPRDRAFLVCFGNHIRVVADSTPEPSNILDGLTSFEKGERKFPEFEGNEIRELGTAFYDAIFLSIRERMRTQSSGRRVLLVFSDGEDNSSAHHMLEVIEAAQTDDVRLYCIRYTERRARHLTARNKYGIAVMDRLARETGGAHHDARTRDLSTSFRQIGEELRATYELAYPSTNPVHDGTFRKIVIRPRKDGLAVHAKTGYYARP